MSDVQAAIDRLEGNSRLRPLSDIYRDVRTVLAELRAERERREAAERDYARMAVAKESERFNGNQWLVRAEQAEQQRDEAKARAAALAAVLQQMADYNTRAELKELTEDDARRFVREAANALAATPDADVDALRQGRRLNELGRDGLVRVLLLGDDDTAAGYSRLPLAEQQADALLAKLKEG